MDAQEGDDGPRPAHIQQVLVFFTEKVIYIYVYIFMNSSVVDFYEDLLLKKSFLFPFLLSCQKYGVQLGTKVPLWGGFCGSGEFAMRIWIAKAKMTKAEWSQHVPALKRAASQAGSSVDLSGSKTKASCLFVGWMVIFVFGCISWKKEG